MIEVVYNRPYHRVTVKGHAHSGEAGHDLVCAAASVLAHTIGAAVTNLAADKKAHRTVVQLQNGDAEVSCTPYNRYKASVTLMFDTVCGGFELLARDFPENVRYELRG
jgi:uncharacterized protein YsxB (DUF464 family)